MELKHVLTVPLIFGCDKLRVGFLPHEQIVAKQLF